MPISSASLRSPAVVGMIPCEPTPTGMWSKSNCVSCSLMGATSSSLRLVRMRRTPQLMSKPTRRAIRRDHPCRMRQRCQWQSRSQCTSGSPTEWPTTPGSAAHWQSASPLAGSHHRRRSPWHAHMPPRAHQAPGPAVLVHVNVPSTFISGQTQPEHVCVREHKRENERASQRSSTRDADAKAERVHTLHGRAA